LANVPNPKPLRVIPGATTTSKSFSQCGWHALSVTQPTVLKHWRFVCFGFNSTFSTNRLYRAI